MRTILIFILVIGLASCKGPEPRKPVQRRSGSYYKESIERSKQLLAAEEAKIQQIIKKDSLKLYQHTAAGSWYTYLTINDTTAYTPKTDDLVIMNYNILSLDNDTIYSNSEIGEVSYRVDRQDLFQGLRDAVKILKEGEKATFLFPSSLAYGYHGDTNKIGTNVPLKSTINILKVIKTDINTDN